MKRVPAGRREKGVLLLTVVLLLALMAALAVSLNSTAGMETQSVSTDYDRRSAAYLAEGAVAAAKWTNEVTKCGATVNVSTTTLPGGGTFGATVAKAPSKKINVSATGISPGGFAVTLARNEVEVIDVANSETKDLGGSPRDTYIVQGQVMPVILSNSLTLTSGQAHALLYWPMNDIPKDAQVLSARLALVQNGSSSTARTINLHRVATQWEASATWKMWRSGLIGGNYWNSATTLLGSDGGGDYSAPVLASTKVGGAGTYTWDVTGLVDGWTSGRLQNYGMLLRLQDAGQSASFYSLEASSNQRPTLRVTFSKQC